MSIKRLALSLTLILSAYSWAVKAQDVAAGEKIFTANCVSCHAIGEQVVGPALKDVHKRKDEAWLIKWIKNSDAVIKSGDAYAVEIFNKFNKMPMQAFENLSDADIKSVLAYIKQQSEAPAATATTTPAQTTGGDNKGTTVTASAGQDPFYNNYTLIALLVMAIILVVVVFILVRIKAVVNNLYAQKFPEEAAEEVVDPKTTLRYKLFTKHPVVGVMLVMTIVVILLSGYGFNYGNTVVGVQKGYAPTQPIAFSHELHAGKYEIDCKYCHSTVEKSKQASIPGANTCMNCHAHVTAKDKYNGNISPEIKKIYAAINWDPEKRQYDESKPKTPIKWIRIHNLPDHAYFNHSQHVKVGKVECQECHGEVQTMKVVGQQQSLQMGWCINCHREKKVDVQGNKYYEKLHANLKKEGKADITVARNGGMECSKCHY
ncbi:MAG: c-type cytochrome [Bacteroidia bacterium]